MVNQLAGQNNKPVKPQLEPSIQAFGRGVFQLIIWYILDPCLGRIRNDKTKIRIFSQRHVTVTIRIRVYAPGDHVNMGMFVYHLAMVNPPQKQVIFTILLLQHLTHAPLNRLHDYHRTVE